MKIFGSISGWSVVFCILAVISTGFPWVYDYDYGLYWEGKVTITNMADPARPSQTYVHHADPRHPPRVIGWHGAYGEWHGAAITAAGAAGLVFLLAARGPKPAPRWRALGVGLVGAAVMVVVILYAGRWWRFLSLREWGGWLAVISAIGLLLNAFLEFRQRMRG